MPKTNHISIRKNNTGSYKVRFQIVCSRGQCGERFQFGLMTRDINIAISRAIMIWNILRNEGYIKIPQAVLSCKPAFDYQINLQSAMDYPENITLCHNSYVPEKFRFMCKTLELPGNAFTTTENEEYAIKTTLVNLANRETRHISLNLMTNVIEEARIRAYVALRILNHIVGKQHQLAQYVPGKKILKKTCHLLNTCMSIYIDNKAPSTYPSCMPTAI